MHVDPRIFRVVRAIRDTARLILGGGGAVVLWSKVDGHISVLWITPSAVDVAGVSRNQASFKTEPKSSRLDGQSITGMVDVTFGADRPTFACLPWTEWSLFAKKKPSSARCLHISPYKHLSSQSVTFVRDSRRNYCRYRCYIKRVVPR